MVFNWGLSDSKSPLVFRTFLSILADLNNAVVWMVSAGSLISNSSSFLTKTQGIVPSAPITIGVTVTFIFHGFFFLVLRQNLSICLFFRFLWFSISGRAGRQSPLFDWFSFSYLLSLGLVFQPGLGDLFVSQNPREFCGSHSLGEIPVCTYTIWQYGYYYYYSQSAGAAEYTDYTSAKG